MCQENLEKITEKTEIWKPGLDIILPVDGSGIPDFNEWVNWNGYAQRHPGYDFAAYLTKDGKCVLGLSSEVPVRAVADGVIRRVTRHSTERHYSKSIIVEHGKEGSGMFSGYTHVDTLVEEGQSVKKGDVIATLYKDAGDEEGALVHLHFDLTHGKGITDRRVDTVSIFPSIGRYRAEPQGRTAFHIRGLREQPKIYIANFKKLLL